MKNWLLFPPTVAILLLAIVIGTRHWVRRSNRDLAPQGQVDRMEGPRTSSPSTAMDSDREVPLPAGSPSADASSDTEEVAGNETPTDPYRLPGSDTLSVRIQIDEITGEMTALLTSESALSLMYDDLNLTDYQKQRILALTERKHKAIKALSDVERRNENKLDAIDAAYRKEVKAELYPFQAEKLQNYWSEQGLEDEEER